MPFSKLKSHCEAQATKIDQYRKNKNDYNQVIPPAHLGCTRDCCQQTNKFDIYNTLKGINDEAVKKGIEVKTGLSRIT